MWNPRYGSHGSGVRGGAENVVRAVAVSKERHPRGRPGGVDQTVRIYTLARRQKLLSQFKGARGVIRSLALQSEQRDTGRGPARTSRSRRGT